MGGASIIYYLCLIIVAVSLVSELVFGLAAIWGNFQNVDKCAWTAGLFLVVGVGGLAILKLLI